MPPDPHTGEGLRRPSPDSTPLGAPALRASAPRSGHRRVPPLQKSWVREAYHVYRLYVSAVVSFIIMREKLIDL